MGAVGQNVAELSSQATKNCLETIQSPIFTNSYQNTVLRCLMLRKSKPAEYFRCVVRLTELPDEVMALWLSDWLSGSSPQTTYTS